MPAPAQSPIALAALALLLHAASACAQPAPAPERRSTLDDQQSVAVTIYNEDLALVKDARRVALDAIHR